MADLGIEQHVMKLGGLFALGGRFLVPEYQRDYSWETTQWDELWTDIEELLLHPERKHHYLGYIVVSYHKEGANNKDLTIIDGQQRIATLSFLIKAVMNCLMKLEKDGIRPEENRTWRDKLDRHYINIEHRTKKDYEPRLLLNRRDNDFYLSNILEIKQTPQPGPLLPSQKRMQAAFKFLYKELNKRFIVENPKKEQAGTQLFEFVSNLIMEKLALTFTTISDEVDAYQVFATLNSRGLDLSPGDLVKNLLFQKANEASKPKREDMDRQWNDIVERLGQKKMTTFLRHWSSSGGELVREKDLYRHIREQITGSTSISAFKYISDASAEAIVYQRLEAPSRWTKLDNLSDVKSDIRILKALNTFRVKQHMPLLLAAKDVLNGKQFSELLLWLEAISFRHSIIGQGRPSLLEQAYMSAVNKLKDKDGGFERAKQELRDKIYADDNVFEAQFAVAELKTRSKTKLIRYILAKIEKYETKVAVDIDDKDISIEHILSQNPQPEDCRNFESASSFTSKLGNYCLLNSADNASAGNRPFAQKKEVYAKSGFATTKQICDYPEWSSANLSLRQEQMAAIAVNVWNIDSIKSAKQAARA